MLDDGRKAIIVDPGDAQPVLKALELQDLQLRSILVTHHHADHVGGVEALRVATGAKVYGPALEDIPTPYQGLGDGDEFECIGLRFRVMDVPGHTAGHIAYYSERINGQPLVFCGDTLFSGGCGRLFEGTPAQMMSSLDALAALPADTLVCCTHEYTLNNLRFARAVEPDNLELQNYERWCVTRRQRGMPTLPSSMGQERQINPFLRSRVPAVMASAHRFDPQAVGDIALFAALREWKNQFK